MRTAEDKVLKIADLVDDNPEKRDRVSASLKDPAQKKNRDHVDISLLRLVWPKKALTGFGASMH